MKADFIRAQALHLARRIGPVGWTGLGALALAVGLAGVGRFVLDPANLAMSDEVAQLSTELARARSPDPTLGRVPDPIAMIVSQLPAAGLMPAFVQDVQDQASRRALQIDRTEYVVQRALGGRALRYRLTMPAHGRYPQLRSWLEWLLHEHPSAALDELSFRREGDGAGQVEARVALSFYCQGVP